jgi:erythromycin esterase
MVLSSIACKHESEAGPPPSNASTQGLNSQDSLAKTTGIIRGVVNGPDGNPVAGSMVAAVPTDPKSKLGAEGRAQVVMKTGPDGAFTLAGLPPDTYGVTATSDKFQAVFVGGVVVAAGANVNVPLKLSTGGALLEGHVKSDDGTPLSKLDVRIIRTSNESGDTFYPVAQGDHFTAYLPLGYSYAFTAEADGREQIVDEFDPADPKPIELTLGLPLDKQPPAPDEVVAWMKQHAVPLTTVEPGHGFDDLEPLKAWIGDAHVVFMGEATHGTREFFQFKHRMLEFLVEKMGFNIFAIEAYWPETLAVNEYVLTGKGDPVQALERLRFWIWDTEEVLALVQWMRTYNADPKHKVKVQFQGFDMQSAPIAVQEVEAFLTKADPALLKQVEKSLVPLSGEYEVMHYMDRPEAVRQAAEAALGALEKALVDHKAAQIKHSSEQAWVVAQHAAHIAAQAERQLVHPTSDYRDECMAENLLWIKQTGGKDAKVMAWAHNGHVAMARPEGYVSDGSPKVSMGALLKKALGSDLFTFVFAFDHGSFRSAEMPPSSGKGVHDFTVKSGPVGSLDATLARTGLPILALPWRQLPADGVVASWAGKVHRQHMVGSVYNPSHDENCWRRELPSRASDALIFISEINAAKPFPKLAEESEPKNYFPSLLPSPTNLDFEVNGGTADAPVPGWGRGYFEVGYKAELSDQGCHGGKHCVALKGEPSLIPAFGSLSQRIAAGAWAGKRVTVRSAMHAKLLAPNSEAALWVNISSKDSSGPDVFADTLGQSVSNSWGFQEVTVDVPAKAAEIDIGIALQGQGTVWLDDVSLQEAAPKPASASSGQP